MHSSSSQFRSRAGFTLIELLTVIAIIGILAAIIIPVIGRARDTAKSSQCVTNLRQIGIALRLYADEHKNTLPAVFAASERDGVTQVDWTKALYSYLPQRGSTVTAKGHPVFVCPSAELNGQSGDSLGNSYGAVGGFMGIHSSGSYVTEGVARRLSTIANPSRTGWIMDMSANGTNPYPYNSAQWSHAATDCNDNTAVRLGFRHGDGARLNMLFGDGHVQGMTRQSILEIFGGSKAWDAR